MNIYESINFKLDLLLQDLNESVLYFGDKNRSTYPKFNNVLILAGGAGSGKSTVLNYVLDFEGKHFDVDELKKAFLNPKLPERIKQMFYDETGRTLDSIDLKDEEDTALMHEFVSSHDYDKKVIDNALKGNLDSENKPNLIFDCTLKDVKKLQDISEKVVNAGYKKENIHIVWVCNSIETALKNNSERDRKVPERHFKITHTGASQTMKKIFYDSELLSQYMDGDIWVVFNDSEQKDTKLIIKPDPKDPEKEKVHYADEYLALCLKRKNEPPIQEIPEDFLNKINSYVPVNTRW